MSKVLLKNDLKLIPDKNHELHTDPETEVITSVYSCD